MDWFPPGDADQCAPAEEGRARGKESLYLGK